METKQITGNILKSKKYGSIYRPTVERMVKDLLTKYPEKQVEKEVKKKLHQLWGAYFIRPKFPKLLEHIKERIEDGENKKDMCKDLLILHTSTKERISILNDFYKRIFDVTGIPETVVDYGCGMNLFSYPWACSVATSSNRVSYLGYDVDLELNKFLNDVFRLFGWGNVESKVGDIFEYDFPKADMYMLLKVVTLLEHQVKDQTLEILKRIPAKNIIVSFPTRSITGKSKGMKEFYSESFEKLVSGEGWEIDKIEFDSELVYIVGTTK
jgi:16S rRNA (guanine(1405)-N(7))-methyltransferase